MTLLVLTTLLRRRLLVLATTGSRASCNFILTEHRHGRVAQRSLIIVEAPPPVCHPAHTYLFMGFLESFDILPLIFSISTSPSRLHDNSFGVGRL